MELPGCSEAGWGRGATGPMEEEVLHRLEERGTEAQASVQGYKPRGECLSEVLQVSDVTSAQAMNSSVSSDNAGQVHFLCKRHLSQNLRTSNYFCTKALL